MNGTIRQKVRAFAPATVSNVGPGFDIMGFALHRPGDTVDAELTDRPGVEVAGITGDGGILPRAPGSNAAAAAAASVWNAACALDALDLPVHVRNGGIRLTLHKGLPLQSGLGSSGASAAAGAFAANELLGRPFSAEALVPHGIMGERAACGSAHADNVAPALLGGFVLIRSYHPLDLVRLPVPDGLFVAIVHPRCRVSTRQARGLVRNRTFRIDDIVSNLGNVAAMVAALHQSNLPLLGRCIDDRLVEPIRAGLIPGYADVKRAALDAGALGCSISGSGPTVFALADTESTAAHAASAMRDTFRHAVHIDADAWMGNVCTLGARVMD
jgi:homoserine kinase